MDRTVWRIVLAVNVLAVTWLVFWYLPHRDRDVREAERAEQRAQALNARARLTDSLEAVRGAQVARLTREAVTARRAMVQHGARADSAGAVADSLAGLLATHLANDSTEIPAPLSELVTRTVRTLQFEGASCRASLGSCGMAVAALDSALRVRDSSVTALRALWTATDSLLDEERRRHRPKRIGLGLGCGYGVVSAAGVLRTGPGCSVGLVIRR